MKVSALKSNSFNINLNSFNFKEAPFENENNSKNQNNFEKYQKYISLINKNVISFKANNGNDFKQNFENALLKDDRELFAFLDKSLKARVKEKRVQTQIADDVVQNTFLEIFHLMEDYTNDNLSKGDLVNKVDEIYKNIRPKSKDYVTEYNQPSLNAKAAGKDKGTLIDYIPDDEEHKIKYLSSPDKQRTKSQRKKLKGILSKANLSDREKLILNQRYNKNGVKTYKKIGEEVGLFSITVQRIMQTAILKMQIKNGTIPQNMQFYIEDFSRTFNIDKKDVQKILCKYIAMIYFKPQAIKENIANLADTFKESGLTKEKYLQICLNHPKLFACRPETVERNVKGVVDKFKDSGMTTEKYLNACLKLPTLFDYRPETIEKNINGVMKKFKKDGLKKEKYLKACLKQPSLFDYRPETIEKNIKFVVNKFKDKGLTTRNYLNICLKLPSLFAHRPETIERHINLLRFCLYNQNKKIDNKEFWTRIENSHLFNLCYSDSLILIKNLVIPKMFEGKRIPKELWKTPLRENLKSYLKKNPDKKYVLNVKNLKGEKKALQILKDTLKEISMDALNRDDVFKLKLVK